jgi:hypothetical protein
VIVSLNESWRAFDTDNKRSHAAIITSDDKQSVINDQIDKLFTITWRFNDLTRVVKT